MMLNNEQWAALPVRAQSIDTLACAFETGNPAAMNDIDWGNCSQYLVSELANVLLALKDAKEVLGEIEWLDGSAGLSIDNWCPFCISLEPQGHQEDCKLAKVLGEGEG